MTRKAQKITIKLPWEITNVYSDVLPDDDEEDDDDIEAHEASKQRLKVSPGVLSARYFNTISDLRGAGSRRRDEDDDTRGVPTLFGLSTSLLHLS